MACFPFAGVASSRVAGTHLQQLWKWVAALLHWTFFSQSGAQSDNPLVISVRRDPLTGCHFIQSVVLANTLSSVLVSTACSLFLGLYWDRCAYFARPLRWWVLMYSFLQVCTVPVRVVLFTSIQRTIARGGSIETCVSSVVASPAWRVSTWTGMALYAWLILGTVWWLQTERCSHCPGITVLVSGILLFSVLRAMLIAMAHQVLMPAPRPRADSSLDDMCPGVSSAAPAVIDALPLVKFSCETCNDGFSTSCSICLADFEQDDSIRRLPCGHDFHQDCIDMWLTRNKRCPLCMRAVDDNVGASKKLA